MIALLRAIELVKNHVQFRRRNTVASSMICRETHSFSRELLIEIVVSTGHISPRCLVD